MEETGPQKPLVSWKKHSASLGTPRLRGGHRWSDGGSTNPPTGDAKLGEDHSTATDGLDLKEETALPRSPWGREGTQKVSDPRHITLPLGPRFSQEHPSSSRAAVLHFGPLGILGPREDLPEVTQ